MRGTLRMFERPLAGGDIGCTEADQLLIGVDPLPQLCGQRLPDRHGRDRETAVILGSTRHSLPALRVDKPKTA